MTSIVVKIAETETLRIPKTWFVEGLFHIDGYTFVLQPENLYFVLT